MSYNLSLVRGYVCPEMEKGWLLGKEPIISVRARRSFSKGNNPVSRSSVSVAWLVMPVHWIRDEHTYIVLATMSSSIVRFFSSFTIINVEMKFINLEL